MEQSSIVLLYQLVSAYIKFYAELKSSYEEKNKERFDLSSSKILEISKKITAIIK
jgi:hypothetical protein